MTTEAKPGRPSLFSQEVADEICRRLANGESLRQVCEDDHLPHRETVRLWLLGNEEWNKAFFGQYVRAREAQADCFADEILEIADDASKDTFTDKDGNERADHELVQRSRLRVDTRKWLMSKVAPKKYGDRIMNEHSGPDGGPVQVSITGDDAGLL